MNIKTLALGFFATMSVGLVAVTAAVNSDSFLYANASDTCEHSDVHHYEQLDPTTNSSGTKEYWVCCQCHQHQLYTFGNITGEGIAQQINDENDDRYIKSLGAQADDLRNMGFGNVTENADGTFTIGKYGYPVGTTTLVIPENVSSIEKLTFSNTGDTSGKGELKCVFIPKTVYTIGENAFDGKGGNVKGFKVFCEISEAQSKVDPYNYSPKMISSTGGLKNAIKWEATLEEAKAYQYAK